MKVGQHLTNNRFLVRVRQRDVVFVVYMYVSQLAFPVFDKCWVKYAISFCISILSDDYNLSMIIQVYGW